MPDDTKTLLDRLVGGDPAARGAVLARSETDRSPALLVAAALVAPDPHALLARAAGARDDDPGPPARGDRRRGRRRRPRPARRARPGPPRRPPRQRPRRVDRRSAPSRAHPPEPAMTAPQRPRPPVPTGGPSPAARAAASYAGSSRSPGSRSAGSCPHPRRPRRLGGRRGARRLVTGVVLGAVQAWGLRLPRSPALRWAGATSVGFGAGLGGRGRRSSATRRRRPRSSSRARCAASPSASPRPPCCAARSGRRPRLAGRARRRVARGLGGHHGGRRPGRRAFTVFGSSGALVVTALTVVLPLALRRRAATAADPPSIPLTNWRPLP